MNGWFCCKRHRTQDATQTAAQLLYRVRTRDKGTQNAPNQEKQIPLPLSILRKRLLKVPIRIGPEFRKTRVPLPPVFQQPTPPIPLLQGGSQRHLSNDKTLSTNTEEHFLPLDAFPASCHTADTNNGDNHLETLLQTGRAAPSSGERSNYVSESAPSRSAPNGKLAGSAATRASRTTSSVNVIKGFAARRSLTA